MQTTTHFHLKKPEDDDLVNVGDLNFNADKIDDELNKRKPDPAQITSGTSITLADNTEYRLANVSNLTINYPLGNFECWLRITTAASGTINISLPTSQYIGEAPDLTQHGVTFELSIKDGVVIGAEVGDGS